MRRLMRIVTLIGLVIMGPGLASGAEQTPPLKPSEKMGQILKSMAELRQRHVDMFGVRPSHTWPLSQRLMTKRQNCSGPSGEQLQEAIKSGLVDRKIENKDFQDGCSRDDNPVADERSFNCFQIGKWQAGALPIAKQILDSLPSLSFKVVLVYKDTPKELGDILIDYFNFDLPAYCSELAGQYASGEARSFNEFLEDRRAFGRVLGAAVDHLESAKKQAEDQGI